MEDRWYTLKAADFNEEDGSSFLQKIYKGSRYKFLKTVFPEVDWKPWKFPKLIEVPLFTFKLF